MKVTPRVSRLLSLAAVMLVALSPLAVLALEAKPPLWHERAPGTAPLTTAPAPAWVEIARAVKPAVVNVSVRGVRKQDGDAEDMLRDFGGRAPHRMRGLGSGFVINASGYVVTNNHVVDGASEIRVKFADGRELPGKVIGRDAKTDLALLKVEATGLPVIPLGDSARLEVGEPVMAIGNPFGLEQTVTTGIVSATGRAIGAGPYDDFIQTDASINPGNSGGPLINARGEVIGINTAIFSRSGGSVGIGFAVPSSLAKTVITQLADHGTVERGWLGVSIQPLTKELASSFKRGNTSGGLVSEVIPGSPADKAGVKTGDVIVQFNGRKIAKATDLPGLVADVPVGRDVPLVVMRDGVEQHLNAHIAKLTDESQPKVAAESDGKGKLGLSVQPVTPPVARELGLKVKEGVLVRDVVEGGRAAEAGIRAGDVIVEVDRRPVRTIEDFKARLENQAKDAPVVMLVNRDGQTMYVAIPAA